jgi:hypothetical protein
MHTKETSDKPEGARQMKKKSILATASTLLLGFAVNASAGDLLGYPVVETQLRFYSLIIGLIAISVVLVAASCLCSRPVEEKNEAAKPPASGTFSRFASAHFAK